MRIPDDMHIPDDDMTLPFCPKCDSKRFRLTDTDTVCAQCSPTRISPLDSGPQIRLHWWPSRTPEFVPGLTVRLPPSGQSTSSMPDRSFRLILYEKRTVSPGSSCMRQDRAVQNPTLPVELDQRLCSLGWRRGRNFRRIPSIYFLIPA
jgi:hypothetical protein